MYFWNTKALSEDLREGWVSKREKMKYLLVTIFYYSLGMEVLFWLGSVGSPYSLGESLAGVGIPVIGILLCYHANNKGDGAEFLDRFICMGWPVGVKVFCLGFFSLIFFMGSGYAIGGESFGGYLDQDNGFWIVFSVLLESIYYGSLRSHILRISGGGCDSIVLDKLRIDWKIPRALKWPVLAIGIGAASFFFIKKSWIYFPSWHGMAAIAENVYVDKEMSLGKRKELLESVKSARKRVSDFYSGLATEPLFLCCSTYDCFHYFGGNEKKEAGFSSAIFNVALLSPDGLDTVAVSHEWSHIELQNRIGFWTDFPPWFHEGLAELVSRNYSTGSGSKIGTRVLQLAQMEGDWHGMVERRPYTSYEEARREVEAWYDKAGKKGFERLIKALKDGGNFYKVYLMLGDGFAED